MKKINKWEVEFLHSDGNIRKVLIEAYDDYRARLRFQVNWGFDIEIITCKKLITN
jgi:hypothetical protein